MLKDSYVRFRRLGFRGCRGSGLGKADLGGGGGVRV